MNVSKKTIAKAAQSFGIVNRTYTPEPCAAEFHASKLEIRAFMGPAGLGKTTAMVMDMFMMMCEQEPNDEGIRNTKWAVVRKTYSDLKRTVLDSWRKWFPQSICRIYETESPITAHIQFPLADGTTVVSKVYFFPMNRPETVEQIGDGLEVTGGWVSGATDIDESITLKIFERSGRFPMGHEGTCMGKRVILDYNPPPEGQYLHRWFEKEAPNDPEPFRKLFRFPPVLLPHMPEGCTDPEDIEWRRNPFAEGVQHNPAGYKYWEDMVKANRRDVNYLKRMVCGDYAAKVSGKPVFPMFSYAIHVSKEPLKVLPGLPLMCGLDWGFMPGFVVGQIHKGCVRIYAELMPEDVTYGEFFSEHVVPLLRGQFQGHQVLIVADPAGQMRSNVDGRNRIISVQRDYGLRIIPGPTQDTFMRIDAGAHFIRQREGLLIDPSCKHLIEALSGGYRYEKNRNNAGFKPTPEKDHHSNIADAFTYLATYYRKGMVDHGGFNPMGRRIVSAAPVKPFHFV